MSNLPDNGTDRAGEVKARLERLLAGHGTTVRLSQALGITRQQLHKIWAGQSGLPEWLIVVAELLERLPRAEWPERWLSAMEKCVTLEKRELIERRISTVLGDIRRGSGSTSTLPDGVWQECQSIVDDAKTILLEEEHLGPWESSDLNDAATLVRRRAMPRLALATVERAMTVSEQRMNGDMPAWHYDEQVARASR